MAQTPESKDKRADEPVASLEHGILYRTMGIWRIATLRKDHWWDVQGGIMSTRGLLGPQIAEKFKSIGASISILIRLMRDVWDVAPYHFVCWLGSSFVQSMETTVDLYVNTYTLNMLQLFIFEGKANYAIVMRCISLMCGSYLFAWVSKGVEQESQRVLEARTTRMAGERLVEMYARLGDLPTLQRDDVQEKLAQLSYPVLGGSMFGNLSGVTDALLPLWSTFLQFLLIFLHFIHEPEGPTLIVICLSSFLVLSYIYANVYNITFIAHVINRGFLRSQAVTELISSKKTQKEAIGGGLLRPLHQEYKKNIKELEKVPTTSPWTLLRQEPFNISSLFTSILYELPLMSYLFIVLHRREAFSLASLAIIRGLGDSYWRLSDLLGQGGLAGSIQRIQHFYDLLELQPSIKDGHLPYPGDEKKGHETTKAALGMHIQFKNVSFRYPDTKADAIKDLSFTIPAGATVIIVGSNGGGKSSTVSLLNRLFDPTDGEILIDGKPLKDYLMNDIREAQAILCQDYQHFPFSIAENIAIGRPGSNDPDAVRQAAQLADAQGLVEEQGLEANVKPLSTLETGWELWGTDLEQDSKKIEKPVELSGGQWQRLALARLFMRAASERVRLVVADEPSASLDPKVEYEIFRRLRTLGGERKKTRIFITHRFGHLTNFADLILCLKEGRLVESGCHQELMELKGEYYELYNIQAQAYA